MTRQHDFNSIQPTPGSPEWNHARVHRLPGYIPPHILRRPPHDAHPGIPATETTAPFPADDYPAQTINLRETQERDKLHTTVYTATEKSLGKSAERPSDDVAIGDSDLHFAGVFDGVGNAKKADIAAQQAAKAFNHIFTVAGSDPRASVDNVRILLERAANRAHARIRGIDASDARYGKEAPATTATFARIFQDETGQRWAGIATVGDSRAYLYRPGNETSKDSFGKLTIDQATIPAPLQNKFDHIETIEQIEQLSKDEKGAWDNRNVINGSLSADYTYSLQIKMVPVEPGDRILLTTDGIHDNLSAQQLRRVMAESDTASLAANLIAQAQNVDPDSIRAKYDDMSCAVVEVQ